MQDKWGGRKERGEAEEGESILIASEATLRQEGGQWFK